MRSAAVAVESTSRNVVGFLQLCFEGMPSELHTTKRGEAYVESVAVDVRARGRGVGTKLLEKSEAIARERGCTYMSLGVVRGNPAVKLYERRGYSEVKGTDCCDECFSVPFICCLFGPVIHPKGSPSYCSWGRTFHMEKRLEEIS